MPVSFRLRQLGWDLDTGLLFRPGSVIVGLGVLALLLPAWEHAHPVPLSWLVPGETPAAQVLVGTIAGSMMTVVSVVYSILLVALSLASVQFSTRILTNFMRDRVSQWVLGLLVGTFLYSLLLLRALTGTAVPQISVAVDLGLAMASLGGLLVFIQHLVRSVQANHIAASIACATVSVIDEVFPPAAEGAARPAIPAAPATARPILARSSGYVQLIDMSGLQALSGEPTVWVQRPMGSFVPEGGVVALVIGLDPAHDPAVLAAFDLGRERTLQLDAEYGVRQIVDVALKAISPAVNDPSTGATCIDHLTALVMRAATRGAPVERFPAARGAGVIWVPQTDASAILDLAVTQLRQYGRADMAVLLRLTNLLVEVSRISAGRDPRLAERIRVHAELIGVSVGKFAPPDQVEALRRIRGIVDGGATD